MRQCHCHFIRKACGRGYIDEDIFGKLSIFSGKIRLTSKSLQKGPCLPDLTHPVKVPPVSVMLGMDRAGQWDGRHADLVAKGFRRG